MPINIVSKQDHCLYDLILRQRSHELLAEIPVVISNHHDLKKVAHDFGINYHHIAIAPDNKLEQEKQQLAILKQYKIDLVVLAKYMQVLQQFAFKPTTNNNIKPFAGLRPATILVVGLINNCCKSRFSCPISSSD